MIMKYIYTQSPFILRRQLHNPHFFQNCGTFQYNNNNNNNKYHNFEINENCATVFLKWTDFITWAFFDASNLFDNFSTSCFDKLYIKFSRKLNELWFKEVYWDSSYAIMKFSVPLSLYFLTLMERLSLSPNKTL